MENPIRNRSEKEGWVEFLHPTLYVQSAAGGLAISTAIDSTLAPAAIIEAVDETEVYIHFRRWPQLQVVSVKDLGPAWKEFQLTRLQRLFVWATRSNKRRYLAELRVKQT